MNSKLRKFTEFLNEQQIEIVGMDQVETPEMGGPTGVQGIPTQIDMDQPEDHEGKSNYMFFENLKTIQRCIEGLMSLDENMIDEMLSNGHNWAEDHMAVAKECVEQVAHFFMNKEDDNEEE